jgi:hypothetical protein
MARRGKRLKSPIVALRLGKRVFGEGAGKVEWLSG